MSTYYLTFTLASDALLGRGDGVAGLIDQEVQQDEYGCPYFGGKTLKGILANECADLLAALPEAHQRRWQQVARQLFGEPGGTLQGVAQMSVGDAQLPADFRAALRQAVERQQPAFQRVDVLNALTTVRRQTAMDADKGMPLEHSLRATRLVLRDTIFEAPLWLDEAVDSPAARRLLAACVKALRRIGTARNRGFGKLKDLKLADEQRNPILDTAFEQFCQEILSKEQPA